MIPQGFPDFYGDQIRWFTGEVIDIQDPLQIARVKIKAHGVHDNIKDDDLPWAQVMAPITQGGTEGLGNFLGIQPGSRVVGLFLDGQNSQVPLIMGSLPKYEEASDGGSSVNVLAKGEQKYPISLDTGGCFPDPGDPYAAVYPHNKVRETESGHVKEYDDTEGAERIRERHKSGTFYQMGPDGELLTHVITDRYSVIAGNDYLKVTGEVKICAGTITAEADTINVTGPNGDIVIDGVSLVNHTHQDNPGLSPGITSPPIKE